MKMFLGRVMGNATATVKHPSMEGWKLLLVMALQADGRTIEGDPILVVDSVGAGRGETVVITSDGLGARELLGNSKTPVRWSVLGIRDE
jgi:ethanolamine utilization protein EutN